VQTALKANPTGDLGGSAGTVEFTKTVIESLKLSVEVS